MAWVFGVFGLLAVGQAVAAAMPAPDSPQPVTRPAEPIDVGLGATGASIADEQSNDQSSGEQRPLGNIERRQGNIQSPTPIESEPRPVSGRGTLVVHATSSQLSAYSSPGSAETVTQLTNPTRHGTPLVLQAVTPPDSPQLDTGWVQVLLPIRPNGTTAWVSLDDVETSINPFSIEVDVDDFELTVKRHGAVYMQAPVGIGDGDTPTPHGSFFLTDLLRTGEPDGIYGPFAYGLSGYSETLTSFNGGEAVIGIHGTNEPWALGSNVSSGCVRVDNAVIEALATFLPLGTPVTIGVEP